MNGNYGWNAREGTFGFDPLTGFVDTSTTPMGMNDPIVRFCRKVLRELPMEFVVEAQKLLGVSLEGSVG